MLVVNEVRGLFVRAMKDNVRAEENEAGLAAITRYSDATIEALTRLGLHIQAFLGIIRRGVADKLAASVGLVEMLGGSAAATSASLWQGVLRKLGFGESQFLADIEEKGLEYASNGIATWTGGSGDQDVARAEQRLKAAKEARAKSSKADADTSRSLVGSAHVIPVNELHRMGMFVGGSPQGPIVTELQSIHKQLLRLEDATRQVGPDTASRL
jgi:hypothetical protein